jgi:hypothetical protein
MDRRNFPVKKRDIPCFKCGKPLEMDHGNIMDGLSFTSPGNYGSTLYDPMSARNWLRIHICDACVAEAAEKGIVLEATRVPRPDDITYKRFKRFNPDDNEDS